MNIGIDIDNVISKFDEALEEEFLKHDKELRNTGIIDPNKHMTEGMFDWSEEELWPFYLDNVERIAKNLGVKEGAKEYIEKLKEAAYMEGCNAFQIYFKVIMPLTKPSFATVAIFAFLWSYNDLFTQMFFLRRPEMRTITRLLNELTSQEGTNYGLMAAAVTLVVVPVVIVYIFLQKYIIKGMTAGAVKG